MRTLTALVAALAATLIPGAALAQELPPGYVEPPGPCVLDPDTGLWMAPGPLPCGPTLLELAGATEPLPPVDEPGCTPVVPSDGCPGDAPAPVAAQTYDGCVGPDDYCTTEPPTTTTPPTTAPPTTAPPAPTTTTTTVAETTTTVAEPTTTTTEAPTTTASPPTSTATTSTSVAVPPPPVPPTRVTTTTTQPSSGLPVTGAEQWHTAAVAGIALTAGSGLVLVARRRRP